MIMVCRRRPFRQRKGFRWLGSTEKGALIEEILQEHGVVKEKGALVNNLLEVSPYKEAPVGQHIVNLDQLEVSPNNEAVVGQHTRDNLEQSMEHFGMDPFEVQFDHDHMPKKDIVILTEGDQEAITHTNELILISNQVLEGSKGETGLILKDSSGTRSSSELVGADADMGQGISSNYSQEFMSLSKSEKILIMKKNNLRTPE